MVRCVLIVPDSWAARCRDSASSAPCSWSLFGPSLRSRGGASLQPSALAWNFECFWECLNVPFFSPVLILNISFELVVIFD